MSKDRLSQYIRQRDVLLTGAREQLKGKRAYVYGSVIRAQGPFNDIDVTVVSPGVGEDNLVDAINGMPTQIDYVDFAQTIADRAIGSRDITL
jgi:predicted nucleotidyltransferase